MKFQDKVWKNGEVESEFVRAIDKLVAEYDTAIYENRFVVGGAVEFLFVALVRALGFNAGHVGTSEKRGDFEVEGLKFSLKTNFTGKGEMVEMLMLPGMRQLFLLSQVSV
jgi:hypothetical protein